MAVQSPEFPGQAGRRAGTDPSTPLRSERDDGEGVVGEGRPKGAPLRGIAERCGSARPFDR